MRTITKRTTSLLLQLQYKYTPVSNFEIQNKVNPIVAVTLGYQKHVLDLHFRVSIFQYSSSKMLCQELLRILRECCLELLSIMGDLFH